MRVQSLERAIRESDLHANKNVVLAFSGPLNFTAEN